MVEQQELADLLRRRRDEIYKIKLEVTMDSYSREDRYAGEALCVLAYSVLDGDIKKLEMCLDAVPFARSSIERAGYLLANAYALRQLEQGDE